MKTNFQIGDKVFDYQYGWGEVKDVHRNTNVFVEFKGTEQWYVGGSRFDGSGYLPQPTLSLTEYTLEGFSQERPINYNDYIGKWGLFWDDGSESRLISRLKHFYDRRFQTKKGGWYDKFKPLSEEQIKILEL